MTVSRWLFNCPNLFDSCSSFLLLTDRLASSCDSAMTEVARILIAIQVVKGHFTLAASIVRPTGHGSSSEVHPAELTRPFSCSKLLFVLCPGVHACALIRVPSCVHIAVDSLACRLKLPKLLGCLCMSNLQRALKTLCGAHMLAAIKRGCHLHVPRLRRGCRLCLTRSLGAVRHMLLKSSALADLILIYVCSSWTAQVS